MNTSSGKTQEPTETAKVVRLSVVDYELWSDCLAAFAKDYPHRTIEHSRLASAIGCSKVQHLIQLGLLSRDGAGGIKKTGVEVADKVTKVVRGDNSHHFGFDTTKMRKGASGESVTESSPAVASSDHRVTPTELNREEVTIALKSLSRRERVILREALKTVDFSNPKGGFRIAILETKKLALKAGFADVSKRHIIHALNRLGFCYVISESSLIVPDWFKELKL